MAMTIVTHTVTGGVDTHGDVHVAAALDELGAVFGTAAFPATEEGYGALTQWLGGFGQVARVGVEGTGAYGAGLARHLAARGIEVVEVDRHDRQARRQRGKSDPLDALEAARAALSGEASGRPKSRNGGIEAIRALVVAKRSARQARSKALTQMRHLVYSAPEELRAQLKGVSIRELIASVGELDATDPDPVRRETAAALCSLAHRVRYLDQELAGLDARLGPLVTEAAPGLLALVGVGIDTASTLLVTAGDNPGRLRSEAAWAHLCGVAPLPASSGRVTRHRLDRGGDRRANSARWRIVMVRLTCHPDTKAYVERRLKEGLSKREIVRMLKRYVSREVFHKLPGR